MTLEENLESEGRLELPRTLEAAIDSHVLGKLPTLLVETQPLSEATYQVLRADILSELDTDCSDNSYHNRPHTEAVESQFVELASHTSLSGVEVQLGRIAALFHDYGHPGMSIRQEAPTERVPRTDLSNEEYAALVAGERLQYRLDDTEIILVQSAILATSFGQKEGRFRKPYEPHTDLEKVLAVADIGPVFKGDFDTWLAINLDILQEQITVRKYESSFEQWLAGLEYFLDYAEVRLSALEGIVDQEYYLELCAKLAERRQDLAKEGSHYEPAFRKVVS